METLILVIWFALWIVTPSEPLTVEFMGQTFPANKADSIELVVENEIARLEAELDTMDNAMRALDETFKKYPDAIWYQNRKMEAGRFRERSDSVIRAYRAELEKIK